MTAVVALIKYLSALFFISVLSCSLLQATSESSLEPCFIPPKNWKSVNPSLLSARVKAGFSMKTGKEFNPSINLTEEKTSLSPAEYLKVVQKIHEDNPKNRWRKLGTIQTDAGTAFLTAIDTETPHGNIRILQSILIKEGTAYILTSATLKEHHKKYQQEILNSFKSITLTKDHDELFDIFKKNKLEEKKAHLASACLFYKKTGEELFKDPLFLKQHWKPFEEFLTKEFASQGLYWQQVTLEKTKKNLTEKPIFEKLK